MSSPLLSLPADQQAYMDSMNSQWRTWVSGKDDDSIQAMLGYVKSKFTPVAGPPPAIPSKPTPNANAYSTSANFSATEQKFLDTTAPGWRQWGYYDPRMQQALISLSTLKQQISIVKQNVQQKTVQLFQAIDKLRPKLERIISLSDQVGKAWQQGHPQESFSLQKQLDIERGDLKTPAEEWDIVKSVLGFIGKKIFLGPLILPTLISIPTSIGLNMGYKTTGITIMKNIADALTSSILKPFNGLFSMPAVEKAIAAEFVSTPDAAKKLFHLPADQLQKLLDLIQSTLHNRTEPVDPEEWKKAAGDTPYPDKYYDAGPVPAKPEVISNVPPPVTPLPKEPTGWTSNGQPIPPPVNQGYIDWAGVNGIYTSYLLI